MEFFSTRNASEETNGCIYSSMTFECFGVIVERITALKSKTRYGIGEESARVKGKRVNLGVSVLG